MLEQHYLTEALATMRKMKEQAEKAMAQVSDEHFFGLIDPEANSIALIIKHVAGNMRSRWTDFLTSDGEKPSRQRDLEFESEGGDTRASMMAAWDAGWDLTLRTIAALTPEDLERVVHIRGEAHSVMQAVNRQVAHYSQHVGQIILLAKHYAGGHWKTLTIPKRAKPKN